ncbi:hypothetical protein EIP91_009197 [Steccherinum ochraceum]|uniref:Uncharacterized protein n=1 Tax=Steccherinum ochraceum TaxID=92696 RepID=A0A4R0RRS3_9APHY|nr:hypothetical protein EIP91_009197 [Steccherinum ochraceum]
MPSRVTYNGFTVWLVNTNDDTNTELSGVRAMGGKEPGFMRSVVAHDQSIINTYRVHVRRADYDPTAPLPAVETHAAILVSAQHWNTKYEEVAKGCWPSEHSSASGAVNMRGWTQPRCGITDCLRYRDDERHRGGITLAATRWECRAGKCKLRIRVEIRTPAKRKKTGVACMNLTAVFYFLFLVPEIPGSGSVGAAAPASAVDESSEDDEAGPPGPSFISTRSRAAIAARAQKQKDQDPAHQGRHVRHSAPTLGIKASSRSNMDLSEVAKAKTLEDKHRALKESIERREKRLRELNEQLEKDNQQMEEDLDAFDAAIEAAKKRQRR